jgi:glycosyltransferase involved in cell wall biosynthesis
MAAYHALTRRFDLFRRHISRFIALSPFSREWLIEHAGLAPDRIDVVAPAVALPADAADPAAGGYVAYAGRFAPYKGIPTLLEAAEQTGIPVKLARSARNIEQMPLPEGVEVLVNRNRAELDAFYRGARMLVLPSVWFETFGLVGAEAMSHGIPVIASRIGAVANLVEEERDGLLFAPGDADDLAARMTRLWNDPALCRRLGSAARRKVATGWTADHHLSKTLAVYESAIASPRR